jgi:hypothetical protein
MVPTALGINIGGPGSLARSALPGSPVRQDRRRK